MPRSRANTADSAGTGIPPVNAAPAGKGTTTAAAVPPVEGNSRNGKLLGGIGSFHKQTSAVTPAPPPELSSNPNSRHRRVDSSNLLLSAAMASIATVGGMTDIEGPMSTTKALMVAVICPRRIGHQVILKEDESAGTGTSATEPPAPADIPATSNDAIANKDTPTEEASTASVDAEPPSSSTDDKTKTANLLSNKGCKLTSDSPPTAHNHSGNSSGRNSNSNSNSNSNKDVSLSTSSHSSKNRQTYNGSRDRDSDAGCDNASDNTNGNNIIQNGKDKDDKPSVPSVAQTPSMQSTRSTLSSDRSFESSASDTSGAQDDAVEDIENDKYSQTMSAGDETPRVGNKTRKQIIDVNGTTPDDLMMPQLGTQFSCTTSTQQTADDDKHLETIIETKPLNNASVESVQVKVTEDLPSQDAQFQDDHANTGINSSPQTTQATTANNNSKVHVSVTVEMDRTDRVRTHVESTEKSSSDDTTKRMASSTAPSELQHHSSNSHVDEDATSTENAGEIMVTPEEAAAVTQGENPDESEINMEELLRITFDTLLREWHLLNVPTVAFVDHQKLPTDLKNPDTPSDPSYQQDEGNWISLQVMVRPSSLGVVLERLERIGVGVMCGTLSIFKVELCKTASPYAHIKEQEEQQQRRREVDDASTIGSLTHADETSLDGSTKPVTTERAADEAADREKAEEAERVRMERMIEAAKSEWKNAATRLRIEQVREQIIEQAAFSFDFLSLLAIASILAAVGLITDNTVVIVASMLVSPIMGPVLGLTFGSRIKDWPLAQQSLRNESLALLGCVLVGAAVGACSAFTPLAREEWPTEEMEGRGQTTGLLTGIAIAIPSGAGVCLSILGGNTSSLVGVAISASLLPPAVNSGICWMYAIFLAIGWTESDNSETAGDFAIIGAISFALTVLNILCIWVAGIVMFEIKEVAPTTEKSPFWARDLKVARELNAHSSKKPPPINMKTIRDGVNTALRRRKQNEKAVKLNSAEDAAEGDDNSIASVRVRPLPFRRQPRRSMFGPQPLGSAWPLSRPVNVRTTSQELWKEMPFHDAPDHGEEDLHQYVGLEDMATLLGFEQEEEDENDFYGVDPVAFAQRYGRGRYL